MEYEDGPILLSGLLRAGISLFHKEFVDQIGPLLADFALGKCYDDSGTFVEQYVTMYSSKWVVPHRDETTKYHLCRQCGRLRTDVLLGPGYFLRSELPKGPVYEDASGALFLDDALADRLDWTSFPDVQFYRFEVLDKPRFGWRSRDDPSIPDWHPKILTIPLDIRSSLRSNDHLL